MLGPATFPTEVGAWAARTAVWWAAVEAQLSCRHDQAAVDPSSVEDLAGPAALAVQVASAAPAAWAELAALEQGQGGLVASAAQVALVALAVPADPADLAAPAASVALAALADPGGLAALAVSAALPQVPASVLLPSLSSRRDLRPARLTGKT